MTRSVFYNLASHEGERAIARLRELGGRIAHHAVWPDVDLDARFEPTVAWHNPDPEYMTRADRGRRQRDDRAVVRPRPLPLRLERALAPRLPARRSSRAASSSGCSCSRTRRSGPTTARRWATRCGRSSTPTAPRGSSCCARTDRPVVKPITVVVTASGAPGTAALLRALRENGEREVRLVGTDMSERSVGRHLCDAFHLVPAGSDRRTSRPRCARSPSARARTRSCRSRRSTSRGSPARSTCFDGIAGARLAARRDPPLERQGGVVRVPAAARAAGAGLPARASARRRSRRRRTSSATPSAPSASSRCSRRGRAASASSTRRVDRADQLLRERPGSVSMLLEDAVEILASVDDRPSCS